MPLESYWPLEAAIDLRTEAHVRFGMRDADALIPCRISFDALRDLFGIEGVVFDPLGLLLSHRIVIEDAASEKYDREGAVNGWVELDSLDFV